MTKNGVVEIRVCKYIMYIENIEDYIRGKLGLGPAMDEDRNEYIPYEEQTRLIEVDDDFSVVITRNYISVEVRSGYCLKPHVTIRFMFPDEISGMSYDEIAEEVIDVINEWRRQKCIS